MERRRSRDHGGYGFSSARRFVASVGLAGAMPSCAVGVGSGGRCKPEPFQWKPKQSLSKHNRQTKKLNQNYMGQHNPNNKLQNLCFQCARQRQRHPGPITAGGEIILSKTTDSKARGRDNGAPDPSTAGREIMNILSKTMGSMTRGRGNGAQNRAPRSIRKNKILHNTMDSTAGGQGNDVPEPIAAGHEIIQNHFQNHGLKGAGERQRQRRATPRTEHERIRNPV